MNGLTVYRKRGDADKWLMYYPRTKSWLVQPTSSKGTDMCWAQLECGGPCLPENGPERTWRVWDDTSFQLQADVAISIVAPQLAQQPASTSSGATLAGMGARGGGGSSTVFPSASSSVPAAFALPFSFSPVVSSSLAAATSSATTTSSTPSAVPSIPTAPAFVFPPFPSASSSSTTSSPSTTFSFPLPPPPPPPLPLPPHRHIAAGAGPFVFGASVVGGVGGGGKEKKEGAARAAVVLPASAASEGKETEEKERAEGGGGGGGYYDPTQTG